MEVLPPKDGVIWPDADFTPVRFCLLDAVGTTIFALRGQCKWDLRVGGSSYNSVSEDGR